MIFATLRTGEKILLEDGLLISNHEGNLYWTGTFDSDDVYRRLYTKRGTGKDILLFTVPEGCLTPIEEQGL